MMDAHERRDAMKFLSVALLFLAVTLAACGTSGPDDDQVLVIWGGEETTVREARAEVRAAPLNLLTSPCNAIRDLSSAEIVEMLTAALKNSAERQGIVDLLPAEWLVDEANRLIDQAGGLSEEATLLSEGADRLSASGEALLALGDAESEAFFAEHVAYFAERGEVFSEMVYIAMLFDRAQPLIDEADALLAEADALGEEAEALLAEAQAIVDEVTASTDIMAGANMDDLLIMADIQREECRRVER